MAILNELKMVYHVIVRSIEEFFEGRIGAISKYTRHIMSGMIVTLIILAGYLGYRWYIVSREQTAYHAIAEYMQDYRMASRAQNPTEWQRVDALLSFGYTHNKGSNIAPFFLLLRADALLGQSKNDEAMQVLDQAIAILPASSVMMPLFKTKRALLLLDSADQAVQKEGLQQLIVLGRDKLNRFNDIALFYLGRYYWVHNNSADAKKVWQELVDLAALEKAYPSPWAAQAKAILKQIVE
jgi:predicted negative regulator of RcsB-dependent stress response